MVSESAKINQPIPLRLRFAKTGDLQYISHLDLNRTFQRAILRAGIPIWYTEGFNPKPRIVFAAPLSVGCQSRCELCDIKTTEEIDPAAVPEKLNRVLPEGLHVFEAYRPETKFTGMIWADYRIVLHAPGIIQAADTVLAMFAQPIVLTKRTKSGEVETDILPYVKTHAVHTDGDALVVDVKLACGSTDYLNPEYIVTAIKRETPLMTGTLTDVYYSMMREEVYGADGVTVFR